MIVYVSWKDEKRRETFYETPYAACYNDPKDNAGERIVIVPVIDGDERTIYMNDVKSVSIWQGGKEIRFLHSPLKGEIPSW